MGAGSLLVTGGCRCGKSAFAQIRAEQIAPCRAFVATACLDDNRKDAEMNARVARHRAQRGPGWMTFEPCLVQTPALQAAAPHAAHGVELYPALQPVKAFTRAADCCGVAVFDCVTLWVSRLLMADLDDEAIGERVNELAAFAAAPPLPLILVTNETGWGVVPESALGRRFRDLAGETNQKLATACQEVVLMISGLPLRLKN